VRLVLDTNTVVSGLFWGGAPGQLQDAARARRVELYSSPALLGELARVLRRRKFSTRMAGISASIEELIEGYGQLARLVSPAAIAPVVHADPDDDEVLACALAAKADLIVSGDSHLLNLKTYQGIPIMPAAEAVKRLPQAR
jgi:putative PIN family toxin of toxin-antitoxin system